MQTKERTLTWKTGPLIVVLGLIIGTLAGLALEKAHGASPDTYKKPLCSAEACPSDWVKTARQGARKSRSGALGSVARVRYTVETRRAIAIKVMRVHNRMARARGDNTWDAQRAWTYWTKRDTCVSGSAATQTAPSSHGWKMTCEAQAAFNKQQARHAWNPSPGDVDLIVCGGIVGLSWKAGAVAGVSSGGWALLALGATGAACLFQDDLRKLAED